MYTIKTDSLKNRLYILVDGSIEKAEVDGYISALKKNVTAMKPGFTALLDLSKAKVFDQEVMQNLQSSKEIITKAGLSKSAIIVESPTLKMQMNRNFKGSIPEDRAFDNISEAEKFLNE